MKYIQPAIEDYVGYAQLRPTISWPSASISHDISLRDIKLKVDVSHVRKSKDFGGQMCIFSKLTSEQLCCHLQIVIARFSSTFQLP